MYKKITVRTRFLAGLIALVLILSQTANSQAADPVGTITTIAGTGNRGSTGDGGPATLAQLGSPFGMAVDTLGNIYIADHDNRVIRKVDPNGIITTVAGTGGAGFAGDGGPATAALLDAPNDVAVDVYGNLYIADLQNRRIRKVNLSGIITTIAGNGSNQSSGDGGPATAAGLNFPHGISVDPAGNLYIASPYDARIRKVDTNGIISTVAGTGNSGYAGDGGPAVAAQLRHPVDVDVTSNGTIYIADAENHRIRKVDTNGIITTIAGTGNNGYTGDNGPALNAQLNLPHGVTVDSSNNIYVGDRLNNRVRKIDANGIITTIAGTGAAGYSGDGGPATQAQLEQPFHLAVAPNGSLYISDWPNHRVRRVVLTPPSICNSVTQIPTAECNALLSLFSATNGSGWTNKSNWLQTNTPCSWFGVTCANGRVLRLDLPNNKLSGTLPPTVDAFSFIQYFDVSRNSITGSIPAQLGNLSKLLYLHIAYNQFTGTIPATLGNLRTVVFFYLHNNQLTGTIPAELSGLIMAKAVIFTNNQLSGTIPPSLGNLPQLQRLHLTNNQFSGAIPAELSNATKLQELYLNSNQFTGALPVALANLSNMIGLRFQNTNLCVPPDAAFQTWLSAIPDVQSTGVVCGSL